MTQARRTTDHSTIKRWVEQHNGHPARVAGTGDGEDAGLLRIDFEEAGAENESLEEISWDEFFDKFAEKKLAVIYQDDADGKRSRFNKLVSR